MIGWIGLGLLLLAYVVLVTRWSKWFIPIDILASFLLTVHAFRIGDIPFVIVNAFITALLTIKLYQRQEIN